MKRYFLIAALSLIQTASAKVTVTYWEKWTGSEKDGMQAVVDDFNASQDRIFVELSAVSALDQKTMIATAGGNPPDIAGLWDVNIVPYAGKNALIPFDELLKAAKIKESDYIPAFWKLLKYQGHIWGLPSTPATTALIWNKDLFAKAGLDPDRPPKTFAELEAYSKKLTKINAKTGEIDQIGFLPSEPGWWNWGWGYFFGGRLWDGGKKITADDPANVEAFKWLQTFPKLYGVAPLQNIRTDPTGNLATPENPFMSGKLAMVLQGVWMGNYISLFAPKMHWGAAPFPVVHPGDEPVTFAGADVLCIPRGAKHVAEAFEFIAYVNKQAPMEKLCMAHQKNSPLRKVSADFYRRHKNPYIKMFQQLGYSKNAGSPPDMPIWAEYVNEMKAGFDNVWLLNSTPEQALKEVRIRMQDSWDKEMETEKAVSKESPPLLKAAPIGLSVLVLLLLAGAVWLRERRSPSTRSRTALAQGLRFASPFILGLSFFIIYPVMASLVYSFCDYSVLTQPHWIGLQNFKGLMQDPVFWLTLKNTAWYFVLSLPLGLLTALAIAVVLDANLKGSGIYRTMFFLPAMTPLIANLMVWMWIFHGQYGILNWFLGVLSFGHFHPIPWLTDPDWAMPSLILMSLWGAGYTMVMFLAALQDVPVALYEAAELDGCSWWRKVWHISMPIISPVIYFNFIMGVIGSLQIFAAPFIMTLGGPARATYFYAQFLYENAFLYLRMGYACALAWILFIIILILTGLAMRSSKSTVHYVGD